MKKRLFAALLFLFSIHCTSQFAPEKHLGSWSLIYANHQISEKWSILSGFEKRNYKTFQNYNLSLYSLGINYKLSTKMPAPVSYLYLDIDRTIATDTDPNTEEHRFYAQVAYTPNIFQSPFTHRFRIEHRNINSKGVLTLLNRARYRLKTKILLNKQLYLTASNECFFNFKGKLYTENRLYSAMGFKASSNCSFEVGYLYQYINHMHLDRLQIGLFLKTDFRKRTNHS